MKIRTQFVLAFFLLAIVPMTAIVIYNYSTSIQAVREAVAAESAVLAEDMEERMGLVRAELQRRITRVGELPLSRLKDSKESDERKAVMSSVAEELGDTAELFDSLEFMPVAPPIGVPPRGPRPPDVPAFARPEDERWPPAIETAPPVPDMVKVNMREVVREVGERLTDVPALMALVEGNLPEGEGREELVEQARLGFEHVAVLVERAQQAAEGELDRSEARQEGDRRREQAQLEAEEEAAARVSFSVIHHPSLREFRVPVEEDGRKVGEIMAKVRGQELVRGVLELTRRDLGEIPFALDEDGNLFTLSAEDEEALRGIPLDGGDGWGASESVGDQWVVAMRDAARGGLQFGIARPIGDSLEELRRTALRNFGFGGGLIGLALLGVLPLSRRMTRDLNLLTESAGRISRGDLEIEVPVRSRNEVGRLAGAFNKMTGDLRRNRELLLEESQLRRDQEVEQELLKAEFDRKSQELEEARSFQLSLLPKELPEHPSFEVAVRMETATEVGGDYYDFRLTADGSLTTVIGDATGHGARAGTMVTVIKSLFSALQPEESLAGFLDHAGAAVRRMDLGRMAMALLLARFAGGTLKIAAAGMPPALLWRLSDGRIEEITVEGMPLGGLEFSYREQELQMNSGDTLLLMSDGFPELLDSAGDPLGYERAVDAFRAAAAGSPQEIIRDLAVVAEKWAGSDAPSDDVTFVVVRAT